MIFVKLDINALLDEAARRPFHRILDVGCGTGSLAVRIKRLHPDVHVVGLDPDSKVLARGGHRSFLFGRIAYYQALRNP